MDLIETVAKHLDDNFCYDEKADDIARAVVPMIVEEAAKAIQAVRAEIGAGPAQVIALGYAEAAVRNLAFQRA